MSAPPIGLQATIWTFAPGSPPTTALGMVDPATGALTVVGTTPKACGRRDGLAYVTDDPRAADLDMRFGAVQVPGAIADFRRLVSMGLLTLGERVQVINPGLKIEVDGLDERGKPLLRVAPDITNGHMAVLALAALACSQVGITDAEAMADRMMDVVSVGWDGYISSWTRGMGSGAGAAFPIDHIHGAHHGAFWR